MPFTLNNKHGKGRPKNAPNKTNKVMKSILVSALFGDEESIARDLESLEPYQRLQIKAKLMNLVLPTQKSVEVNDVTIDDNSIASRLERYTDEQIAKANAEDIAEQLAERESKRKNLN